MLFIHLFLNCYFNTPGRLFDIIPKRRMDLPLSFPPNDDYVFWKLVFFSDVILETQEKPFVICIFKNLIATHRQVAPPSWYEILSLRRETKAN